MFSRASAPEDGLRFVSRMGLMLYKDLKYPPIDEWFRSYLQTNGF